MIEIIIRARNKEIGGEITANDIFIESEVVRCLLKSLMASLNGWSRPMKPTLFGPFRVWIYLRILRSRIV